MTQTVNQTVHQTVHQTVNQTVNRWDRLLQAAANGALWLLFRASRVRS